MDFEAIKEDGKLKLPRLYQQYLEKYKDGTRFIVTVEKKTSRRTLSQNNALHLWFQLLADALNDAGYSIQHVIKFFTVELSWTKDSVKEILWRTTQKALLKKKSTTELNKQEDIDTVWEHLNRSLGEKLSIHVPFPVDENRQKEKQYVTSKEKINYPQGSTETAFDQ